jgi:hypothetical protein
MKVKDRVKSHLSLWSGEIGTVSGIIKRENCKEGDFVHVVFAETDKHYGFQQSFNSKDLTIVNETIQN